MNFKHLEVAKKYAGISYSGIKLYMWHLWLALSEAGFLFVLSIASILHGFFPFLYDFDLLTHRINRLKLLKQRLPNDPQLNRIEFRD